MKSISMQIAGPSDIRYNGYYAPSGGKVFDVVECYWFFYVKGSTTGDYRFGLWRAKNQASLPDRLGAICRPGTSPFVLVRDLLRNETYR